MGLEVVTPGAEETTLNALLYGAPKSGKSTGAASAPGPVLYLNAERPNALRFAHRMFGDGLREVRPSCLADLHEVVLRIRDGVKAGNGEATVVVDPVGDLHRLLLEEASSDAVRPKLQEYGDVAVQMERFCRALCDAPINAVFVAHETSVKDEDSGGFLRQPWMGTSNPAPAAKLMAMVDVIGYVAKVEGKDDEPDRYMAQLTNANGRYGGDRTGALGKFRELDLAEWVRVAHEAWAPKTSRKKEEAVA